MAAASDPSPHGLKLRHILIGLACLALLYVLSFGPVVYMVVKVVRSNRMGATFNAYAKRAVLVAYYPHLMLMANSDTYFAYGQWCAHLGGDAGRGTRLDMKRGLGL